MTTHIYYFTRTGNAKRIAQKIAKALTCEIYQINDNVNWKGIRAYFKFMAYTNGKRTMEITCDGNPDDADELIVIAPIWASMLAPTVSQFLTNIDKQKIHLVTTAGSSQLRKNSGYKSVTTITKKAMNEDNVITEIVNKQEI